MAEAYYTRFGIIGCANIARKVSRAILLSGNSTIVAVGSRSLDKATAFAVENDLPKSVKLYGTYQEVIDDVDVDAVYIPLPTSLHLKWTVLAAQRKKHVLLEKPVALNTEELDRILEACESNGVQYMDATMWMHHPRTVTMKKFLSDSQRFGEIKSIHSVFAYKGDSEFLKSDIRVQPDLDALGVLGDCGWYCIRAILWSMNYELPKNVTALPDPEFNESGVLLSCSASLSWRDGRIATFYCSFLTNHVMDIRILGSKGDLRVHDFVIPFEEKQASFYTVSGSNWSKLSLGWEPSPSECIVETDIPQEALMVREFSRIASDIRFENSKPETKWITISRKTQLVVDAVKTSLDRDFAAIEVMY